MNGRNSTIDFGARRNVPQNAFAKPVHLAFAYLLNHGLRLLCRMHPESPKEARHSGEASPGSSEPQNQIPIHRELKALIKLASYLLENVPPPEHRLLRDIVSILECTIIVARENPAADFVSLFVYHHAMAVNHVNIGAVLKETRHIMQCARQENVVGIQVS